VEVLRRILLPTDSSLPALAATIEAVKKAKEINATLIILSVIELTPSVEVEQHAENVGLRRCPDIDGMMFARELAKQNGVEAEEITQEGPVAGTIVHVAEEFKVETIIMGCSKPHGITELYLGDVARSVIKMAKCEVVAINPTEEQGKVALVMARKMATRPKAVTVKTIISTKQFKVGLVLFTIFISIYSALLLLGSFERSVMAETVGKLNVGMVLGFTVIILAIVMAVVFNWYASKQEA
jgi:nucleotide-binding universal stress UspA family protein/uncharacterized membrane protein (DUF485 family)